MSSDSASVRSKLMLVVFGTRLVRSPFTSVPGTPARMAASSRSRSAARSVVPAATFRATRRAATPKPASAGTFSVPPRRLRSCLPPVR